MSDLGPYGVVHRRLWERRDFRPLSFEAKALFCYLRTCPSGGLIGIFRFHPDDAAEDLGMSAEKVGPALAELERGGFVQQEARWVWVVEALGTTPGISLSNPKHVTAVVKALRQVPSDLAVQFARVYTVPTVTESLPDSLSDTHSEASPNAYTNHVDVNVDGYVDGDGHANERRIDEEVRTRARARDDDVCDEESCGKQAAYAAEGVRLCASHSRAERPASRVGRA